MNKPSWWQIQKIKWGLGIPLALTENVGFADEVVIRYKDKFISILEDPKTGEIKSLAWSKDPHMFPTNINDFWTAKKDNKWANEVHQVVFSI